MKEEIKNLRTPTVNEISIYKDLFIWSIYKAMLYYCLKRVKIIESKNQFQIQKEEKPILLSNVLSGNKKLIIKEQEASGRLKYLTNNNTFKSNSASRPNFFKKSCKIKKIIKQFFSIKK